MIILKDKHYCSALGCEMVKGKKEVVEGLLKKNEGYTIVELSKLLKISRNTIAVILAEFKGANLVKIREVGRAKLYYWKGGRK